MCLVASMTNSALLLSSLKRLCGPFINQRLSSVYRSSSNVTHSLAASETEQPDCLYRKLDIELRGHDPAVLKSYAWFASTAANELGIKVGENWCPRKANHNRLTLLKSVHVHKRAKVQYEIRTYFRFIEFLQLTGSTADTFLEYIQRNLPEGVAMKATKYRLEFMPEHLDVMVKKNLTKEDTVN